MTDPSFLDVADSYHLGMLDTERPHPMTQDLSLWAREDLPRAIDALASVDRQALVVLEEKLPSLSVLAREIHDTLARGHRIFLCGCGATGRLSISLEILARQGLVREASVANVRAFMAGGDAALIRSIERFEDHPEYGERQLLELGFSSDDLLVASTEGGETPFVIGATETAATLSSRPPFFLYCNPDSLLKRHVERSRRVLESSQVRTVNLATGPMALAGSTRMQASTVLMAAIGLALKHHATPERIPESFAVWQKWVLDDVDPFFLVPFIEAEAATCLERDFVLYQPGHHALTVLTDTTERSPTFSLAPFERRDSGDLSSLCYLHLEDTRDAAHAWKRLLRRAPRPLEWGSHQALTGRDALLSFDFSDAGIRERDLRCAPGRNYRFRIGRTGNGIQWEFRGHRHTVAIPPHMGPLFENLLLKMLLNRHSTLIMGRLGRFEGNLMTFVSASNFKLIDRAIRYTRDLLQRRCGGAPCYETVARQLLLEQDRLPPGQPVVLRTVESLLRQREPDLAEREDNRQKSGLPEERP